MLANELRPQNIADVIGQEHLVGTKGIITKMIAKKHLLSMVLYGEAGCGKTTIARLIVKELGSDYLEINATNSNKKDLESAIATAKLSSNFILIVDEIHRLNKDKQDILLPHVESGLITLIGITNSNPFHALNKALRSRVILLEVKKIKDEEMKVFIMKTFKQTPLKDYDRLTDLCNVIINNANQDVRYAINQIELISLIYEENISFEELTSQLSTNVRYDKNDDNYYDIISALQKSIRGSDVNAALFYLALLIIAQDLDIIERRVLVCAYEDVGLADPAVVDRVSNALRAARLVGFPEAKIPLAFCVIDLCLASKSNQAYQAINRALDLANNNSYSFNDYLQATPINNAKQDYYNISYNHKHLIQYLPNELKEVKLYQPIGKSEYEKHLKKLNDYLNQIERSANLKELAKKLKT